MLNRILCLWLKRKSEIIRESENLERHKFSCHTNSKKSMLNLTLSLKLQQKEFKDKMYCNWNVIQATTFFGLQQTNFGAHSNGLAKNRQQGNCLHKLKITYSHVFKWNLFSKNEFSETVFAVPTCFFLEAVVCERIWGTEGFGSDPVLDLDYGIK